MLALDLETTSPDPATARIVEIALVPIDSMGAAWVQRMNPGIPIPSEATAVHGIGDADVAGHAPFAAFARELLALVLGVTLVGHNVRDYDVPVLWEEFARAGLQWDLSNVRIVDTLAIDRHHLRHTLEANVQRYLGREHVGAHGAESDARAAGEVFSAQMARYGLDLDGATALGHDGRIDLAGKLAMVDGHPTYTIGKAKGRRVADDPGFGRWMLGQAFTEETKMHLRRLLGRWS